jgi:uncharacterized RDD family membrane protein YckC
VPRFEQGATHVTGRRVVAQIVDAFVLAPAALLFGGLPLLATWLLGTAVMVVYFGYLQGERGWTIGKLLTGIRLVDRRGRPPGVSAGVTRTLPLIFEWFGLAALVLILRSPWRQRAGDRWAETYVIRRKDASA